MLLIKPRKNRKKGFTLIELIVVVAILAILAAVAIPSFVGLQSRAQQGVAISDASSIAGALNIANSLKSGSFTALPTWTTYAAMSATTALGNLAPNMSDAAVVAAVGKLAYSSGVFTVNTTIS